MGRDPKAAVAGAVKCCCCGQVLPPTVHFSGPVKQRIYDFMVTRPQGATAFQIMDAIYADDPNGGPESVSIISSHASQMNRVLKRHGLQMRADLGRSSTGYRLQPI